MDRCDFSGVTPIMMAAGGGHESCLEAVLIAAAAVSAAIVNAKTTGEHTEDKIKSNVILDVTDVDGNSACHYACKAGEVGTLALLADAGARLDIPPSSRGKQSSRGTANAKNTAASVATPIRNGMLLAHLAVSRGFLFCLEELVARGVCLEATDQNGETTLSLAALHDSDACVEFLLTGGGGSTLSKDDDGREAAPTGRNAKPLVDPNRCSGPDQERLLTRAARRGLLALLSLLLRAGADPTARERGGETVLHAAARFGQARVIETLSRHVGAVGEIRGASGDGVKHDERNSLCQGNADGLLAWWSSITAAGETATFIAASKGHVAVCRALQAAGALEPSRPNADGATPMVVAALAGHMEVTNAQFSQEIWRVRIHVHTLKVTELACCIPPSFVIQERRSQGRYCYAHEQLYPSLVVPSFKIPAVVQWISDAFSAYVLAPM